MKNSLLILAACAFPLGLLSAADPAAPAPATPSATPAKPVLKINPGEVIVPIDKMRRIWGELVSIDLQTRTGKFRAESTDQVMSFTVLPYAELLHHATFGDLQDFRIGERAIFRLHENEAGEWVWLTYIQDEMNFLNGHKEYYYVDAIDAEKGRLECTDANFDKSYVREKGIRIETDANTRYWKGGQPAKFSDIQIGDKLRTKTHGIGKGKVRVCWEVFLDDESLLKFQAEQKAAEAKRLNEEGAPGYVDQVTNRELHLTLFQESGEIAGRLKPGQKVRLAPAGVDRKPTAEPLTGTISTAQRVGTLSKVSLSLDADSTVFVPKQIARLWIVP